MKTMTLKLLAILFGVGAGLGLGIARPGFPATPSASADGESARQVASQKLPEMDGKNLTATVVEVSYPPGTASRAHSHPCPVLVYVLEGTVESQVQGQPAATYTAGQTFYEPPHGVHAVSRNVSDTKPARILAYFLCDKPGPLSVPPPGASGKQ